MGLTPRQDAGDVPAPADTGQSRLRPRVEAQGRGAPDRPVDLRGMSRADEQTAVGQLPKGTWYVGDDGGYRQNRNGPGGNKIEALPPGAKIGPDGNIYGPDPKKAGSAPRYDYEPQSGWYLKSADGQLRSPDGRISSKPTGTGQDVKRGFASGFLGTFEDTADQMTRGQAPGMFAGLHLFDQASRVPDQLNALRNAAQNDDTPAPPPPATPMMPGPGAAESAFTMRGRDQSPIGANYQPRTAPGRWAKAAGASAPYAALPTGDVGIIPQIAGRAANVLLPAAGSQGAQEATRALGGNEDAQQAAGFLGGLAGGAAAGFRTGGMAKPGPAEVAPTTDNALVRSGIAPDSLPAPVKNELQAQVARGVNPEAAALNTVAQSLPVKVPMSLGDMTGSPVHQLAESAARRGAHGEDAANTMRGFDAQKQAALRGNVDAINSSMAGGEPVRPGEGGAAVSNKLNETFDAQKAGINDAYGAAKASSEGANLPSPERVTLGSRLKEALDGFSLDNVPKVKNEINSLGAMGTLNIGEVHALRTRLSNLRGGNDLDATAAGQAVRAIDKYLGEAVDRDLFSGDPAAVTKWKEAIGKRAAFGKLFEGDDLIEGLTERTRHGEGTALKVSPEDAANYIFGKSNLGAIGQRNLVRDSVRLKNVLGENSPEWNKLRADFFARLAREGEGAAEHGEPQFSGQKFAKAWNKLLDDNPGLANNFFTPSERATISHFAKIAQKVTTTSRGGDNPSNSGFTAISLLTSMPGIRELIAGAKTIPGVKKGVEVYANSVKAAKVRNSTIYAKPPMAGGKAGVRPGAGMVAGAFSDQRASENPPQ